METVKPAVCGMWPILVLAALAAASPAVELPRPGGLRALPAERTAKVPLANGGFEDGLKGWSRNPCFSAAGENGATGKACLRFDATVKTRTVPSVSLPLPELGPGRYVLRFRLKADRIAPVDRRGGVRISIDYRGPGGRRRWPSTQIYSGTFDWRQVEWRFMLAEDMAKGSAALKVGRYAAVKGDGGAFFDDFQLLRLVPPDVEAYLLYPNYRGYLPADGPNRARVWVRANRADAGGAAARVKVCSLEDGSAVATAQLAAGKTEGVIDLDAAKWPLGRYALQAGLGGYEYPAYHITKISARQRRAFDRWFDANNVLYVKGKASFPIGFYNTAMKFATVDESEIARLDVLAQAPTNASINYTWWVCSLATRKRYLGQMHKRGIWYLDTVMPFTTPGRIKLKGGEKFEILNDLMPGARSLDTQEKLDRFVSLLATNMRQFPGHGGWYVMDERPFGMVPRIFHQYTVLRAADPDHPTYGVSNKPGEMHFWRDTFDVFGFDPYPLFNMALGRPLTLAATETRIARRATHDSRPVWMVIQYFQGWSKDRWPTQEELRTMSLMAITEGARGLFYWSFGQRALGSVRNEQRRREYWQRALAVTKEVKQLEPALVAPDDPAIVSSVSDPNVRWRARAAEGKWYVFAYLPAGKFSERRDTPAVDVTFTLKDGRTIRRQFSPDTADWFEVRPR